MSLSSLQLDAFQAVARQKGFSAAAQTLGLTQSALSQRVLKLEDELGATLFVREPSGIRLTELGEKLLRYCESKTRLEEEFLAAGSKDCKGLLRVGSFSTLTQSILLPVLGGLVRENPGIRLELVNAEMRELPAMLSSGRVDFLFTYGEVAKQGVASVLLGYEENVLVRPNGKAPNVFLDHDPEDQTTMNFFRLQGKKLSPMDRSFLADIYSILEGVKMGLGQAVAPRHLLKGRKGIEVVPGYKPLRVPIYLNYYSQPYYTQLQNLALARFQAEIPERLGR